MPGRDLDVGPDDLEDRALARPVRVPVDERALDVVEAAQREEVVLLVVVERRFLAQPAPERVRIGVDVDVVRVVVEPAVVRRRHGDGSSSCAGAGDRRRCTPNNDGSGGGAERRLDLLGQGFGVSAERGRGLVGMRFEVVEGLVQGLALNERDPRSIAELVAELRPRVLEDEVGTAVARLVRDGLALVVDRDDVQTGRGRARCSRTELSRSSMLGAEVRPRNAPSSRPTASAATV